MGDDSQDKSFWPVSKIFETGDSHNVEPFGGRSSNKTAFPFFDFQYGNKAFIGAIGWTGQWCMDIARDDKSLMISCGLANADFYLKPGETARMPRVLIVSQSEAGQSIDSLRREFRALMRDEYSPNKRYLAKGKQLVMPIAMQTYDRYCFKVPEWLTEEGQIRIADLSQKCGVYDTLWLDNGWHGKSFPFSEHEINYNEGFKNGLSRVSQEAEKRNMQFCLWFEPERVYKSCPLHSERPDWLISIESAKEHSCLNFAKEEVCNWLYKMLSKIIVDCKMDIYRQDFNFEPLEFWLANDEPGRVGMTEIKYVEGMYWLWDSLQERFPDLLIDNCASGGRRIDLESCMRSVPLWRSDTGCSPISEDHKTDIWNQNQTIVLSRYIPYHGTCAWNPNGNEFRAASSMGIATNFDIFSEDFDFELAGKALRELKHLSHYWNGDFYALTEPSLDEKTWAAYQLACKDSGFCAFFRRESCDEDKMIFKINGIDESKVYRLILSDENYNKTNTEISGEKLSNGIELFIKNKHESLIIEYIAK